MVWRLSRYGCGRSWARALASSVRSPSPDAFPSIQVLPSTLTDFERIMASLGALRWALLWISIAVLPRSLAAHNAPQSDLTHFTLFPRLPTGTCNAQTPCVNAACCGTNGLCGYSPSECGSGNCTSNCDAKAQCGQYAPPASSKCPLDVCCSQFGYDRTVFKLRIILTKR